MVEAVYGGAIVRGDFYTIFVVLIVGRFRSDHIGEFENIRVI